MVTSPDSFFSREYNANFVITDEGRDMLHRNLVNERRGEIQWTYSNDVLECNIRTGETRPIARDATALSRACSRTQDNSGVLSHENTFTLDNLAIFSSNLPNSILNVNLTENDRKKDFDWYGGCHRCYQFSMLFGNASNSIGEIESEEDFEKYKMQFVDHYNEKHKDLYEWRRKKIGKKPITSQKNIDSLKDRIPNQSSISGLAFFNSGNTLAHTITIDEANIHIENINGIDLVTTPRPEITDEDHAVIWELEATGDITDEDRERLNMQYGESIIINALKKYRDKVRPRRGFRDQSRREPFGRSMFHRLNSRDIRRLPFPHSQ